MFNVYAPPSVGSQPAVGMDEPVPNYPTGTTPSTLPVNAAQTNITVRAALYLSAPAKTAIAMKLSV